MILIFYFTWKSSCTISLNSSLSLLIRCCPSLPCPNKNKTLALKLVVCSSAPQVALIALRWSKCAGAEATRTNKSKSGEASQKLGSFTMYLYRCGFKWGLWSSTQSAESFHFSSCSNPRGSRTEELWMLFDLLSNQSTAQTTDIRSSHRISVLIWHVFRRKTILSTTSHSND